MRLPHVARLTSVLGLLAALGASAARAEDPAGAVVPTEAERAEVQKLVDELRTEASRIRGLPWKRDVPSDLLSRDQMIEHFQREMDEEYTPQERERDTKILRRVGMLQPNEDLVELTNVMLRAGVQGFYDPKEGKLYLIAGISAEAQKPAILHELIHALEDQHFDLQARVRPWEDTEPNRLFAEKCVEEGSAEHARGLFEKDNPEAARKFREEQMTMEALRAQIAMISKVPAYLLLTTMLQYDLGPKLVGSLVGDDYAKRMGDVFANPPTTEEQCLHPEKWTGEKRDLERRVVWGGDVVAAAGEGWKKLHEIAVGELDLALFLDYHLGGRKGRLNMEGFAAGLWATAESIKAANGWDAGRDIYVEKDGQVAYVSGFAFDTPRDAEEAAEAFLGALVKLYGGLHVSDWSYRSGHRVSWTSGQGAGRLLVRGDAVLVADGFPADRLDAVWRALEPTRFERQEGDAYPPP